MESFIRQAGAIPFRYDADGLRVLLITTRGAGKWVIPKGWIEPGVSPAQAAAQEAFEEAGITGVIGERPLGSYAYTKRLRSGQSKPVSVEVYALHAEKQLKNWPERAERRFKWMTVANAAGVVRYPGIAMLLRTLEEIHGEARI